MRVSRNFSRSTRLAFASSQPYNSRMSEVGNRVYVGNLSWEVSWQDLKDHMKTAGKVIHADVFSEPNGRSKGCGVVEFATPRDAHIAIAELNDTELRGRKIFIREDRESDKPLAGAGGRDLRSSGFRGTSRGSTSIAGNAGDRTLIVENLPSNMAWQDLKDLMKSIGFVARADITTGDDGQTVGIVEFKNSADVDAAIDSDILLNQGLSGRRLYTSEENTRGGSHGRKLYVGQLAWGVSWQDLKDHFKTVGEVTRADVALEDNGRRSKGYGFVEFADPADAERAIQELNNSELQGRRIHVREDREA
jgi:RNA recognition motif-containing protein